MLPQYKMVLVSSISSIILLSSILFYRYIYPRKHINLLVLLLIIALLPLISIFRAGSYESGDLSINAIKLMSLFKSVSEGYIFSGWASDLNATYGYPLFIFTYPLPYYVSLMLHIPGLSFVDSIKALLFSSYILSGIMMYIWLKYRLGKIPAFVGAVFYLFSPYHLVDLHFRVDIGEVVSYIFLPVILFSIDKYYVTKHRIYLAFLAVAYSLLILSHQAISLAFSPFIILYLFVRSGKENQVGIRNILYPILSVMYGLVLSCFYWLPVIFEKQYTYQSLNQTIQFQSLRDLLYSPWRYGLLFQGHKGELSFLVGYIQLLMIIFAIYLLSKRRLLKFRRTLLFSLASVFLLLFFILPVSRPFWNIIPLINNFQFAYRLLVLVSFFTSVIAAITVFNFNKRWFVVIICLIVIFSTILNWGNRKTISDVNDAQLAKALPLSTYQGEGLGPAAPLWMKNNGFIWMNKVPDNHLEIISGNAKIETVDRKSSKHDYVITAYSTTLFKENTAYFPGWKLMVNNNIYPIIYTNKNYPGIITFSLHKGKYYASLIFDDTPVRRFSKYLSLLSLILILVFFISKINYRLIFHKLK